MIKLNLMKVCYNGLFTQKEKKIDICIMKSILKIKTGFASKSTHLEWNNERQKQIFHEREFKSEYFG